MENFPLTQALLSGNIHSLPDSIQFLLSRTGLIHMFSSAGLHLACAMIYARGLNYLVLRKVKSPKLKPWARASFHLFIVTLLGLFSNWSSPMVRAFSYLVLRELAIALEIRASKTRIFLFSLGFSLFFGSTGFLSFLLSAVGMASIIYSPRLNWITLALAPWLATSPLIIYFFGSFSLAAPLWNLLFGVPLMILLLPLILVGFLANFAHIPILAIPERILASICEFLFQVDKIWPNAIWVNVSQWLMTSSFFLFLYIVYQKSRSYFVFFLAPLLFLLPQKSLIIFDVGQGDSILFHGEKKILFDTGPLPWKHKIPPILNQLERQGIGQLDEILITHPDLDHRGGLPALLLRHQLHGGIWIREESLSEKGTDAILLGAERVNVPVNFLPSTWHQENVTCWTSPPINRNNLCPLCLITLRKGKRALLTGDMDEKAEQWFIANLLPFPTADIVKIAHHGSRFSSSEEFLRASNAGTAVISVGKNRYGHPSVEAMERIYENKMKLYRTDEYGTLQF